jgi:hypothetical protein
LKLTPSSGQGGATVSVTATANDAASARVGSLTVNDQRIDLTQEGRGCAISLAGPTATVAASGGHDSLTISTLPGCPWTIMTSAPWVVPTVQSGSGAAAVPYDVLPNTDVAREASVTVGAAMVTVSQAGAPTAPPCSFSLDAASRDFPATGGAGSVAVTASLPTCTWVVTGSASWLALTTTAGSGTGSVPYSVAANTTPTARMVSLTIAGRVYTITQQGIACTIALSPPSLLFPAAGGTGKVQVTAPAGCPWTAASSAGWAVLQTPSGVGTAEVTYQVQANTDSTARTATLVIGGQTHAITQDGAAIVCTFDLTPATRNFPASGGSATVHVATGTTCSWTAVSSVPWITIPTPPGPSGSGTADLPYTVAANTATIARSGTVTVAGKVHTVTQDAAAPACTYTLSPAERTFGQAGGSGTVTVTTGAGCAWTAVSNNGFVTVQTPSGTSSGTISYLVAPDGPNVDRTATITVNGAVHTVIQKAN